MVAAAIGDGGHQTVEKRTYDASNVATRAEFIAFSKYLAQVKAAKYEDYSSTPVRDKDAFVEIQQHILSMYGGVIKPDKVLSYIETGDYVDCLPFMQQPTIHLLNLTEEDVKPTANVSFPDFPKSDGPQPVETLWQGNMSDPYGNKMECMEGTVPLARLTLDHMTKFGDLEGLFQKPALPESSAKNGTATGIQKRSASGNCTHIHEIGRDFARFGDRYIGAGTAINIWKPAATFSLSQLWLVFEASSRSADQSVESGWEVGHTDANPRTFIYFKSRAEPRVGCWNIECAGFVVRGTALHIGRGFSRVSSFSTTDQWEVRHVWILAGGRWILFRRTGDVFSEIGFYPASLFGSTGMASGANGVDFGGEVCDWPTTDTYGQMGSGRKSEAGFGFAAYQRLIQVLKVTTRNPAFIWREANLWEVPSEAPTERCYNKAVQLPGGAFGAQLFFGGPGGRQCDRATPCPSGCPATCVHIRPCNSRDCWGPDGIYRPCCEAAELNHECDEQKEYCRSHGC
jgi:hypothetical protein